MQSKESEVSAQGDMAHLQTSVQFCDVHEVVLDCSIPL